VELPGPAIVSITIIHRSCGFAFWHLLNALLRALLIVLIPMLHRDPARRKPAQAPSGSRRVADLVPTKNMKFIFKKGDPTSQNGHTPSPNRDLKII
jgi:hypothetical protein